MPKRKVIFSDSEDDDDNQNKIEKKKVKFIPRRPTIKIEPCPPINCLKDLIAIGKQNKFYKNINCVMLWNIIQSLEELDNMIGMSSLKESIFYQTIYYLQNMHLKNKNEEYLHTMILGQPGTGKCLAKNTPIIMYDGSVKMVQDIKIGDKLMGDDSALRNVTSLARGKEKMYKIKQKKGDEYIVNESHILSLKLTKVDKNSTYFYINNKKYKKYDIIDISVLDYLNLNKIDKSRLKGFKVGIEFEKKETDFDPYMLGIWLGDSTKINVEELDLENKNSLTEVLTRFDLINNKHIPNIYKTNDKEVRLKLLAGILDSNSKFCNNYYRISQKNKKLADDIVFLARSLGFYVSISESYKYKTKDLYYNFSISGNGLEDIPVLNKRENILKKRYNKDALNTEINIEELEIDDYYGFTIDGNSRFLLGDFTVTHNTTVAKIVGSIYKNIGILSNKGVFKIAGRSDLIGEYLGSTAVKTTKMLDSCLGGVLFIDEVYSLGAGQKDKDSYSKECVDTLCGFLSEHKNDFCCIIAGYEKEVKDCFLSINPGLERRFPWVHKIDEYTSEDLTDIFMKLVADTKWELNIDRKIMVKFFEDNKPYFKNAGGDIETFISKIKLVHSKRVFTLDKTFKFIITDEDIKEGLKLLKKYKLVKEEKKFLDYYT